MTPLCFECGTEACPRVNNGLFLEILFPHAYVCACVQYPIGLPAGIRTNLFQKRTSSNSLSFDKRKFCDTMRESLTYLGVTGGGTVYGVSHSQCPKKERVSLVSLFFSNTSRLASVLSSDMASAKAIAQILIYIPSHPDGVRGRPSSQPA